MIPQAFWENRPRIAEVGGTAFAHNSSPTAHQRLHDGRWILYARNIRLYRGF